MKASNSVEFTGFAEGGIKFLSDLEANNNRVWFQANKTMFQEQLEMPAKMFLAEMSRQINSQFSSMVEAKIFRIYRDTRFSKDKTPYNPFLRMAFVDAGPEAKGRSFYFSLEPSSLCLGVGCLMFDKSHLERYREAVINQELGGKLIKILDEAQRAGLRLDEPELKRVPRGFDKSHVQEALLRRKGLAIWFDGDNRDVVGPRAVENCLAQFKRMAPLYEWLGSI